ncbi:unnamed protein product [Ceutorhynchus assimilis]|uniref:MADF domain-containing protein n=1 Tax=Ceutorhynchus assimilis TaxID=467358 RepID=A0A9N9QKP1_9CUCU|nr:unnamed protein product [Ceutorhynchus assimilis]
MKENAFQAIAGSMQTSVENCKKKWKALKEKYHREKQKLDVLSRSGAAAFNLFQWNLMSFFQFMYDKQPPRSPLMYNTSSSATASCSRTVQNAIHSTPTTSCQLRSNIGCNRTKPIAVLNRPNKRKKTEQPESGDSSEVVNILSQISNSVSNVTNTNSESKHDKLRDFANYLISELREFATDQREEFMDETVIRLLQSKRKYKKL